MAIVLPDAHMDLIKYRRRGGVYISASDLLAFLYKAAAVPEQEPIAAQAFRHLAETIEEVLPR